MGRIGGWWRQALDCLWVFANSFACRYSRMPSLCLLPQLHAISVLAATALPPACRHSQRLPWPFTAHPIHPQAAGRPRLSSRERAVAIRSLIVATASQSAEAALGKALADVEAFRCGRRFAPGRGRCCSVPRGAAILQSVAGFLAMLRWRQQT